MVVRIERRSAVLTLTRLKELIGCLWVMAIITCYSTARFAGPVRASNGTKTAGYQASVPAPRSGAQIAAAQVKVDYAVETTASGSGTGKRFYRARN